ncbi:hypothetical protein QF026_000100 [Streptomyces aurantiacus]|nr:hypothetical protein [Streptomyces aurantiacus]MDQ0771634.1 hypothetical protein [Streptomyces aurantiacus]
MQGVPAWTVLDSQVGVGEFREQNPDLPEGAPGERGCGGHRDVGAGMP